MQTESVLLELKKQEKFIKGNDTDLRMKSHYFPGEKGILDISYTKICRVGLLPAPGVGTEVRHHKDA